MAMAPFDPQALKTDALAIRRAFLGMHARAKAGHIGTGLSDIDILTYLYRVQLRTQDRFILSKGHGASSLYAVLHRVGIFSDELIQTYYQDNTSLPAHPAPGAHAAIPAATGSLGHGLSVSAGMAYGFKYLSKTDARVACLCSDGELNEGAIWEAAMFSAHHRLTNLTVVVDANGLQGFGRSEDVMNLEPLTKKWESFGFECREANGHDFAALHTALVPSANKPLCVIARTVKGKGVSFMENKLEWHYLPLNDDQLKLALAELDAAEASAR